MDYRHKYLKYKSRYLYLKNQYGGFDMPGKFKYPPGLYIEGVTTLLRPDDPYIPNKSDIINYLQDFAKNPTGYININNLPANFDFLKTNLPNHNIFKLVNSRKLPSFIAVDANNPNNNQIILICDVSTSPYALDNRYKFKLYMNSKVDSIRKESKIAFNFKQYDINSNLFNQDFQNYKTMWQPGQLKPTANPKITIGHPKPMA